MAMKSLADQAGAGTTVALTADRSLLASEVFLGAVGGAMRMGDSNAAVGRGVNVAQNATLVIPPPAAEYSDKHVLADIYVYLPVGTTLTVAYKE